MSSAGTLPVGDAWEAPSSGTRVTKKKKAPKAKKLRACKYGERDADGRCPPKPRARKTPRPKAIISKTARKLETKAVNAAYEGITKGATAAATEIAARGGVKAATKEVLKKTVPIGVGAGVTTVGASILAAAAVGLAAYLATSYAISKIKDAKKRQEQIAHDAADAFRKSHQDLAKRLKRQPTVAELGKLRIEMMNKIKQHTGGGGGF